MQQCVYKTKICDIGDLQKRLMQTWFDFEQNVNTTLRLSNGATVWDHVCVLVPDTLKTCCKIIVQLHYVVCQNKVV